MRVGDLVREHLIMDEVGIVMEVIDDEMIVVLWPYDKETETMYTWQVSVLDSLFEADSFCP